MKNILLLAVAFVFCAACSNEPRHNHQHTDQSQPEPEKNAPSDILAEIQSIENAHQKEDFLAKKNVSFDIQLFFGGTERLNGNLTLSADSRNGKITTKDGSVILFNDDKVYVSTDQEAGGGARFSAYTWSYFFMFPYKLSDTGTVWNPYSPENETDKKYDAHKLTFKAGTGDAPDDWYIMFSDKENHLIHTAAYIVTAGGDIEEAEKDPHAIEYCDYTEVEGLPLATTWRFWEWRAAEGYTRELGNAALSNIQFMDVDAEFYTPADDYKLVE